MTRAELVQFLRRHRLAVQASVAPGGAPQAAVVGFAVSDGCEIVFDTVTTTRKYRNLTADPRIALVIGWDHEITAQIEGVVDFPTGDDSPASRMLLRGVSEGRDRLLADITHAAFARPESTPLNHTTDPPTIVELTLAASAIRSRTLSAPRAKGRYGGQLSGRRPKSHRHPVTTIARAFLVAARKTSPLNDGACPSL